MSDGPDNLVLAHLRELRGDIEKWRGEMNERLDRIEGNGLKMFKSFVGHRSMVERTVADFDHDVSDLKRRVTRLEETRP
ncbi:MAG: hypothetical protein ACRC7G_05520 [Beijerinckiaceae bacterium]